MTRDKRPQSWPELPLMRQEIVIEAPTERNLLVQKCTQEALNFIKESTSAGHPFFLYLPHTMPGSTAHPFSSPAFQGTSFNGAYGDAVEELDWSTGEIMRCLDDLKIADNTLLIWTSDNGAVRRQPLQGSNSPYRGWGYDTSEGAMRMPCIMRWGSVIPAGTVNDSICSTLDLLPTFAEIIKTDLPQNPIDGKSILNVLKNPEVMESHWDKSGFLYYFMGQLQAIRSGPFKLYLPLKNKFQSLNRKTMESTAELYNVRTDVAENQEISRSHPESVDRLMKLAELARRELGDIDRKGYGERDSGLSLNPKPLLPPKNEE
jgi:arylsulfatase A-like enzyme